MKENFQLPLDHCENLIVTYKLTETGIYLQQLTEDIVSMICEELAALSLNALCKRYLVFIFSF